MIVASSSSLILIMCCVCIAFFCFIRMIQHGSRRANYVVDNTRTSGKAAMTGPWTSREYGNMQGHTPIGDSCKPGEYVTDIIGFHGQGEHTNALQFWCYNPKTRKTRRVFKKPTCGKRDRPDHLGQFLIALTPVIAVATAIAAVFFPPAWAITPGVVTIATTAVGTAAGVALEIASGIDADNDVLKPSSGRKMWDVVWTGSPYGYNAWSLREKDGVIQGLKLSPVDTGDDTGGSAWIGGNVATVSGPSGPQMMRRPTGNITTQACPSGYVVTGVKAACGDRVDGIQFTCNRPDWK